MAELRLGLVQIAAPRSKSEAREKVRRLLGRARVEADIIAFPEYMMFDPTGLPPEKVAAEAEPLEGPWIDFVASLASEYSAYVLATMYEHAVPKPFNTAVLVAPNGHTLLVYRKTHLFDAYGYRESSYFQPGPGPSKPVDVKGFRVAVAICFEIRFPELFRHYALEGADVILVPSGWYRGPLKEETFRFLAQARAHENTVYLAAPILYGERFTGRSLVVDPYGVVVAEAGHGERYVEALVERSRLDEARRDLPLLRLRRPSLYSRLCS